MINPQWLELPMYRTNFYGHKDVRAIEVRLYFAFSAIQKGPSEDSEQTARMCSLIRIFTGRECPKVSDVAAEITYLTLSQ